MDKEIQTRKLRYSRNLLEKFNYEEICSDLCEISEVCDNIRYMVEDDDLLVSALGDNDDEAYEFRMAFGELSAKCERLYDALSEYRDCSANEYFDIFFSGVADGSGMRHFAYDATEEDYFAVTSYEDRICSEEAKKKLMRMKKDELIECSNRCFRILTAYLDLKYKYDYLSATMQILNDEQRGILDMVKGIEQAYYEADKEDWYELSNAYKQFEHLLKTVPDKMWIE